MERLDGPTNPTPISFGSDRFPGDRRGGKAGIGGLLHLVSSGEVTEVDGAGSELCDVVRVGRKG